MGRHPYQVTQKYLEMSIEEKFSVQIDVDYVDITMATFLSVHKE